MRVVGLDVCKNSVVACVLDAAPTEPRKVYYDYDFPRFFTDSSGIKALLALNADVAVLEPTGVNYSKFWITKLAEYGVEIALVGHRQLNTYRVNLDLPDKDDSADALALACYYIEHQKSDRRFVRIRDPIISQIRDISLRLQHLNRVQSPIVNRIRQDLAWQFPEAAFIGLDAPLFWGWLASEKESKKYQKLYQESVGLGLKEETESSAKAICELQRRERALELQMRHLMKDVRFLKYRKVFAMFGFGERTEALILAQIYPLENYFGADGKPEVQVCKGRVSGKPTKRHLSRRRFQKALGVAPTREDSGDKKKSKKAGSSLIRMALWQWVFTRIEPKRNRVKNALGAALSEIFDHEKQQSRPIRLIRSRIASRAIAWLFAELVKELVSTGNN